MLKNYKIRGSYEAYKCSVTLYLQVADPGFHIIGGGVVLPNFPQNPKEDLVYRGAHQVHPLNLSLYRSSRSTSNLYL